ncbi:uncharacterized protein H6S33_011925 [Morchella sextelata]|uniref:uncharacterized protein n=1 Tax=Morchella sextelata TaxID=1174677 RepID=UPI001D04955C|nr:uncharacterized protein H6S33_011925 [Morchella sextelata]KAH0610398.1 hypothetical protein H6S33_011925 [Morchella sextelata]
MTSVDPSPPKRIKLPGPPASKIPLLLRPQSQSASQSTTTTTTTTTTTKPPAPPQVFTAASSLRFRPIGSPRLSQSPVRKQPPPATPSFFQDSDVGSSVTRLGTSVDSPGSGGGGAADPGTPTPAPRRPVLVEKAGNEKRPRDEDTPLPAKEKTPQQKENVTDDEEALRKLLSERVAALRAEIEGLKDQRELEEARIARESAAVAGVVKRVDRVEKDKMDDGLQALVQRLLAANDGSHTTLPALKAAEVEEDELIPSARPRESADPGAFHCLTFTRASTSTYTPPLPTTSDGDDTTAFLTTADTAAPPAPLQEHTATGYASTRLLTFTLTFILDPPTSQIHSLSTTISPWARAELTAPLAAAAAEGDVNRVLYALSSYTVLAKRRAGVFARCTRSFPDLLPATGAVGVVGKGGEKGKVGRREMVAWLGRSVLVFRRRGEKGGVELVVCWRISVDDVGEAESGLSADVRFPGCWKDADDRGSLRKVGEVFTALVKDRGVFEAVRCVVGLVFQ